MMVHACFECGALADEPGACAGCGLPMAAITRADLPALDDAWLDGTVEDLTYERIQAAFAAAIAAENREAARRAAKAGKAYMALRLREVSFAEAAAFIDTHHRHHRRPQGWKFGIGLEDVNGELRGVLVVGRPVARMIATRDPGALEVTRCCVLPGTPNGASMLYGAAWRAAQRLGCARLITYILDSEPGTSLRAAGWVRVAPSRGGSWSRPSRGRVDQAPTCPKWRWERAA